MILDRNEQLGIVGTIISVGASVASYVIRNLINQQQEAKRRLLIAKTEAEKARIQEEIDRLQNEIDRNEALIEEYNKQGTITKTGSYIALGVGLLIGFFVLTRSKS